MSAYTRLFLAMVPLVLALELPLYAALAPSGRRLRALLGATLGNAVSYPLLWFFWVRVLGHDAAVYAGEASAVLLEGVALVVCGVAARRAFAVALVVNLYSWAVGEWMFRAILPRLAP